MDDAKTYLPGKEIKKILNMTTAVMMCWRHFHKASCRYVFCIDKTMEFLITAETLVLNFPTFARVENIYSLLLCCE